MLKEHNEINDKDLYQTFFFLWNYRSYVEHERL